MTRLGLEAWKQNASGQLGLDRMPEVCLLEGFGSPNTPSLEEGRREGGREKGSRQLLTQMSVKADSALHAELCYPSDWWKMRIIGLKCKQP